MNPHWELVQSAHAAIVCLKNKQTQISFVWLIKNTIGAVHSILLDFVSRLHWKTLIPTIKQFVVHEEHENTKLQWLLVIVAPSIIYPLELYLCLVLLLYFYMWMFQHLDLGVLQLCFFITVGRFCVPSRNKKKAFSPQYTFILHY